MLGEPAGGVEGLLELRDAAFDISEQRRRVGQRSSGGPLDALARRAGVRERVADLAR